MTVLVPLAERSGQYRRVQADVGGLRQLIAAISGVATLSCAPKAGPRALLDLLPELRARCLGAARAAEDSLSDSCDSLALSTQSQDAADRVLRALVVATEAACAPVLGAIEEAESRGVCARTRLSLQSTCVASVHELWRVCEAIELLQLASVAQPIAVRLEDLLADLVDDAEDAERLTLRLLGATKEASAASEAVATHPRLAVALLRSALALAREQTGSSRLAAHLQLQEHRVLLVLQADRQLPGDRAGAPEALLLRVPHANPFDPLVISLVSASLASPISVRPDGVYVELLRA